MLNKNFQFYKNNGFTLIEIIIYIALFSIMMGGLIVIVFQLIQSSEKLSSKDTAQEEINFVLKKIDWALTDAKTINSPTFGNSNGTLEITNFSGDKKIFKLNGNRIEFCQSTTNPCTDTDFNFITTLNVKVDSISFKPKGTTPDGIESTIIINNLPIVTTKYLRIQNP